MNDREIIDEGFKSMISFGNDKLVPHFIYSGEYYICNERLANFKRMFLAKMKEYGIKSSILTILRMWRRNLITKEKAKDASEGKLKNENSAWRYEEVSINDDLEMFLANLLNSKEIKEEEVHSFFTPQLTEEELKLVENKNEDHLNTYLYHCSYGKNPDVDPVEMKKSDSESKYVHGGCWRRTFPLMLEKNKKNCCNII